MDDLASAAVFPCRSLTIAYIPAIQRGFDSIVVKLHKVCLDFLLKKQTELYCPIYAERCILMKTGQNEDLCGHLCSCACSLA